MPQLIERAHRIIDWELSIQHPDGAFPGHFGEPGSEPVIFNTGQIMHGMLAGYLQLRRDGMPRIRGTRRPLAGAAIRTPTAAGASSSTTACRTRTTRAARGRCSRPRSTAGDAELRSRGACATSNGRWRSSARRAGSRTMRSRRTGNRSRIRLPTRFAGFFECGVLLGNERYVAAAVAAARVDGERAASRRLACRDLRRELDCRRALLLPHRVSRR